MSSNLTEIKYTNKASKVFNLLKKKKPNELKGIVIDSIADFKYTDVLDYLSKQIQYSISKNSKFYNYFIDKDSKIYKLLPDEYAGNVCKYNRYSTKASIEFPVYCPLTDGTYSPRDYSPDEIVESILIEMPNSVLTPSQDTALRNLISYLAGKYNSERKEMLITTDNIYLRRMFPMDNIDKQQCGNIFDKLIDFMIFKRKIKQSLIGNSTTKAYKLCVEKIDELEFNE